MTSRSVQSSTGSSQGTSDHDRSQPAITSRGVDTITSLPFSSFDGITWIPNVSPDREIQPTLAKNGSIAQDVPNVVVKTEDGLISSDMHGYEEIKDPTHANNGTGARHISNLDRHDNSLTVTEEKALNLVSGVASQVVYMFPQPNTSIIATTTDSVTMSQGPVTQVADSMGYQSKLKQAVTKAKAKKRGKALAQQPAFSKLVTLDSNDSLVKANISKNFEGEQNVVLGSDESETTPIFVAVPLTNVPVGISRTNNSNEVNITPGQYFELLNSGNQDSQSRHMHDTFLNVNLPRENLIKNTHNNRLGPVVQTYHTATNDIASGDVLQIPVSEMCTFDHMEKEAPDLSTPFMPMKFYKDKDLCGAILEAMWSMIETNVFWDATIYVGMHSIKAHKLVLSSVCNLIHTRVISSDDSVLKLRLPRDLDHKAVQSFVKYLYHGSIIITTGNVKDMYRLSNIFEMEALKKYVYDFCTEPVLTRIILQCSKDTANDILFDESEIKTETAEIPAVEITNTTAELIENIDLEANEITIEFEKVEDKKEEVVFDWTGVDENESNIPIRKRGRSRKGIVTSNAASKTMADVDVPMRVDQTSNKDTHSASETVEQSLKTSNTAPKSCKIEKQTDISSDQIDTVCNYSKLSKQIKGTSNKKHVKELGVSHQMNKTLPDPFDNGKFDESKLVEDYVQKTSAPIMVTRFRGTNRNVLKAAAKKKAKRNEGINSKQKQLKDKDNMEESGGEEKNKPKKQDKIAPKSSRSSQNKRSTSPLNLSESDVEKTLEKVDLALPNDKDRKTAMVSSPPNVVKKGRAKRSITEPEIPQKSEAIMRPPPKKRTKEISEMMKNVDKELLATVNKLQEEEKTLGKILKKKKAKGKPDTSNLRLPMTQLLLRTIANIDDKGSDIEGERMFRCDFCGNEYLCAKRILTHIVKSHDTLLDKSAEHVTVLKKNLSPKMCDICGYKAKDPNIYYIHFHKYFRHGVSLPHGWSPHKCDLCQKEFFTKFQLKEHKLAHFEETPFICQHCGTGFRNRTGLNSHMFHKHSKEKKHACTECTKTFKTRTQMLVHSRIHSGSKPFACSVCTYRSTTRGNMRLHLTNRHKLEVDVIKDIMENLKATEPDIPVDEDGVIIKMKESGFAVKLGASDGQALQIDPAGSAETQSMDTLAHVAASTGDAVPREGMLSDNVAIPSMQDQSVMTDIEEMKSYNNQFRNRQHELTSEKQDDSSELQAIREDKSANQNMPQSLQLVFTSNSVDNHVEMRILNSEAYPIDTYRSPALGVSDQGQSLLSDNRIRSSSGDVQESRMLVRNVLQRFDQRPANDGRPFSLLKEALAQSPVPSFDPRDGAAAEIIEVSEAFFQESNMMLNQQTDQMGGTLPNDYTGNSRPQDYEAEKDISAEPLQLVMNNPNLQNKQARQFSQSYLGIPAFSQPYGVKAPNKVLLARLPEIPTIIPEDIQQLEHLPVSDQPQTTDKSQGYDLTSKSVAQHNTQEQQLMYDDYYQQTYQHGYHQSMNE